MTRKTQTIKHSFSRTASACRALLALAVVVQSRDADAQSMSSATRKITTQAVEIGGSPTTSTSNALTSVTRKTAINVGRTADNQKTTTSFTIREGYIPTLFDQAVVTIVTNTLPNGITNVNYSQTLQASGGTLPYSWSIAGGFLPDGLSLNAITGIISGTPFTVQAETFFIKVTDSSVTARSSMRSFSIVTAERGQPLNPGLNTPYNLSTHGFVADGWQEFTWPSFNSPDFLRESNIMLEGDSAQIVSREGIPWRGGVLQHVPVAPGVPFTASIQAIMASTESGDDNVQIGIGIAHGITTDPNNIVVSDFKSDHQIDLRVWNTFQTTITPTQDHVTVFPVAYNKFAFDTHVTFDSGATIHSILQITTQSLPDAMEGRLYSATLVAINGSTPFTWSLVGGELHPGLTLNPSTGVISGTPQDAIQAISGPPLIRVTDSSSPPQSFTREFGIGVALSMSVVTTGLSRATLSQPYGDRLQARGGNLPLSWAVIAGSFPPGLSLDTAKGDIFGIPTGLGTFNFTVQVTDGTPSPGGPVSATGNVTMSVANSILSSSVAPNISPFAVFNENTNETLVVYETVAAPLNSDIKAVRVNSNGSSRGSPVIIAASAINEAHPKAAYSVQSSRYFITNEAGSDVVAVILDDDLNVVVPQFTIDDGSASSIQPKVIWSSIQDIFVVVWADNRSGRYEIRSGARTPTGATVHNDVSIRQRFGEDIIEPAIAYDFKNDHTLIAYTFATSTEIRAQLFDGPALASIAPEVTVAAAPNQQNNPALAYNDFDNEFAVVWQDSRNGIGQEDILGKRVAINGVPIEPEFIITPAAGSQLAPAVSYNKAVGLYFVVWQDQTANGDFDIQGRAIYQFSGTDPTGPVFPITRISSPTSNPDTETINERSPSMARLNGGEHYLVCWNDDRTQKDEIVCETVRHIKSAIVATKPISYSSVYFCSIVDPALQLSSLSLRIGNTDFPFSAFGSDVGSLFGTRYVEFDVPTDAFNGTSQRIAIVTSGDIISNVFFSQMTPPANACRFTTQTAKVGGLATSSKLWQLAGVREVHRFSEGEPVQPPIIQLSTYEPRNLARPKVDQPGPTIEFELPKVTPSACDFPPCICKNSPKNIWVFGATGPVPNAPSLLSVTSPGAGQQFDVKDAVKYVFSNGTLIWTKHCWDCSVTLPKYISVLTSFKITLKGKRKNRDGVPTDYTDIYKHGRMFGSNPVPVRYGEEGPTGGTSCKPPETPVANWVRLAGPLGPIQEGRPYPTNVASQGPNQRDAIAYPSKNPFLLVLISGDIITEEGEYKTFVKCATCDSLFTDASIIAVVTWKYRIDVTVGQVSGPQAQGQATLTQGVITSFPPDVKCQGSIPQADFDILNKSKNEVFAPDRIKLESSTPPR